MVLLHGGYWRDPWRRDLMDGLAVLFTSLGFATWNLEYRRIGPEGGYPATLIDVGEGIDFLRTLPAVDTERVTLLGHSAGGHLALWAGGRSNLRPSDPGAHPQVIPNRVVGLAPVSDLEMASELGLDEYAASEFLGGTTEEKFRVSSPLRMLPLSVPQLIVHGDADLLVPVEMSRRYVEAARAAGDEVAYEELPGVDHMSLIDPDSVAVSRLLELMGER